FRQELYPFASGGPVVHMVTARSANGMKIHSGWLPADRELVGFLKHLRALDSKRAAAAQTEPAVDETAPTRHDTGPGDAPTRAFVLAGAAGAALVVAVAAAWRRRRLDGAGMRWGGMAGPS